MAQVLDRQTDLEQDRGRPACAQLKGLRSNPPSEALHRVVVVGGGAAGLELVTRFGNRLGRRGRSHVALVEWRFAFPPNDSPSNANVGWNSATYFPEGVMR